MRMSVNLAGPQIVRGDIVSNRFISPEETGLAADFLELEITETFVMEHVDQTVGILNDLRNLAYVLPSTISALVTRRWPP